MSDKPILHLNLKKKWFDMILSGEKKEEYRELKTYWRHIFNDMFYTEGKGHEAKIIIKHKACYPKDVIICFSNGYRKDRRQFHIECTGLLVGRGRQWWGADTGKDYFVLSLGEII